MNMAREQAKYRKFLRTKSPDLLPMYVNNLIKCKVVQVSVGCSNWTGTQFADELGAYWTHLEPVWYYDLRFVSSGHLYGTETVQARTKRDAIKKIKLLWGVERIDR